VPRFDIVVLVETSSPAATRGVQATPEYRALLGALTAAAKRTHVIAARNAKRDGDVDKTRPGTLIFNCFVADDPAVMLELFDYLAGWYEAETGLDNSTFASPLDDEKSDYVAINHARWDASLPRFAWQQFSKRRRQRRGPGIDDGQPERLVHRRRRRPRRGGGLAARSAGGFSCRAATPKPIGVPNGHRTAHRRRLRSDPASACRSALPGQIR
jgi:hypothetical protein